VQKFKFSGNRNLPFPQEIQIQSLSILKKVKVLDFKILKNPKEIILQCKELNHCTDNPQKIENQSSCG
jgi:hypothetical protein